MNNHFNIQTIKGQVEHVLNQHPTLNMHGMDLPTHERVPARHPDIYAATLSVKRYELKAPDSLRAIYLCTQWIAAHMYPTPEIRAHSYYLKHQAEKDIGYITDGQFITAAILVGYTFSVNGGINADIYGEIVSEA